MKYSIGDINNKIINYKGKNYNPLKEYQKLSNCLVMMKRMMLKAFSTCMLTMLPLPATDLASNMNTSKHIEKNVGTVHAGIGGSIFTARSHTPSSAR